MDINLDRKEKKAECRVNKTERVRRKEVHACTLWSCNNMYSKCWLCTTCFFGVFFFKKPMLLVRFVLENKQYTSEGRWLSHFFFQNGSDVTPDQSFEWPDAADVVCSLVFAHVCMCVRERWSGGGGLQCLFSFCFPEGSCVWQDSTSPCVHACAHP